MPKQSPNSSKKVTIADVADACDVSPATVSLVLRDKPGVGDQTRRRVLDAAQSLGYVYKPSLQSQAQARAQVNTMGLIVRTRPDDSLSANDFYAPVLAGIEAVCRQQQINLMYSNLPVNLDNQPLELPLLLNNEQIDGFLLVGMCIDANTMSLIKSQNLPVVLVDAYASGNEFDAVVSGNFEGAVQAVTYLIKQGHQEIAVVGSEVEAYPSIAERRAGYQKAIIDHQLPLHFIDSPLLPEPAAEATLEYLANHEKVTAVFSCNDQVAVGVMKALTAAGRKIPEDISIIGFDNIPLAQHITPALTTMRVDKGSMGRMAAQLLIHRIDYPAASKIWTVIQPQLLERQSVSAVPQTNIDAQVQGKKVNQKLFG